MTVSQQDVDVVRTRAAFACEYCGVTETDCGGLLTVDHHCPQSHGGTDSFDNLVYCCWRCNLYKAAYWPSTPTAPTLWSPRSESRDCHLLLLADGRLYPRTPTGEFTLARLRLNRPALIAHRLRRLSDAAAQQLLADYKASLLLLQQMQQRHEALLTEHRALLQEQRAVLRLLSSSRE